MTSGTSLLSLRKEIKYYKTKYYELYANKLGNLDEMAPILQIHKLPKLTREEKEKLEELEVKD